MKVTRRGRPDTTGVTQTEEVEAQAQRFSTLWAEYSPRVMAYAQRHVDHSMAQDVVAETFLVAWRRLEDVPGHPLPWLLVVARNTISSQRRSRYRQDLGASEFERLERVAEPATGADVVATERASMLSGLASLTFKQREALLLVAWDGLSPEQAAKVAGCATSAFRVRLCRARRRLRSTIDANARPPADATEHPLPYAGGTL